MTQSVENAQSQESGSGLLLAGTIIGGLAAGAAALLLAPKSGKELREDLAEQYEAAMVRVLTMAGDIGDTVKPYADSIGERAQEAADSVRHAGGQALDWAGDTGHQVRSNGSGRAFLIGGLLGAAAALLLAPKAGRELRADLMDQYGSVSGKTREIAGTFGQKTADIAQQINQAAGELAGKVSSLAASIGSGLHLGRESGSGGNSDAADPADREEPIKH